MRRRLRQYNADPRAVLCTVCGIRLMLISQSESVSLTWLTVRLTPLTVTEPLYARNRASARGAAMRNSQLSPTGSNAVTRPTPST